MGYVIKDVEYVSLQDEGSGVALKVLTSSEPTEPPLVVMVQEEFARDFDCQRLDDMLQVIKEAILTSATACANPTAPKKQ